MTLQKAGRDVHDLTLARLKRAPGRLILGAKISIEEKSGDASVEFYNADMEAGLLSAMSDDAQVERQSSRDERYQKPDNVTKKWPEENTWKRVQLHGPAVKLAVSLAHSLRSSRLSC